MVKLRIKEILAEQKHTKYWLYKRLDLSYQNLSKIMNNETSGIQFKTIDTLCRILNCSVGDLFAFTSDDNIDLD